MVASIALILLSFIYFYFETKKFSPGYNPIYRAASWLEIWKRFSAAKDDLVYL